MYVFFFFNAYDFFSFFFSTVNFKTSSVVISLKTNRTFVYLHNTVWFENRIFFSIWFMHTVWIKLFTVKLKTPKPPTPDLQSSLYVGRFAVQCVLLWYRVCIVIVVVQSIRGRPRFYGINRTGGKRDNIIRVCTWKHQNVRSKPCFQIRTRAPRYLFCLIDDENK